MPSFMHWVECHHLFGKEVVVSNPLEKDMIPLAQLAPVRFSATSNTEYFGPMIPRIFKLWRRATSPKRRASTGRPIRRARRTPPPAPT